MLSLLQNKTILVVDDDPQNRETVMNSLFVLSPKTNVLLASDGKQALQIVQKKEIHVILLDWEMPVMNGYQTLQELKANPDTSSIPVVMYTGVMTDIQSLQQALKIGAADFLRKPTEPIEILSRIHAILTQQEAHQAQLRAERERYESHLQQMTTLVFHLQQQETLLETLQENLQKALQTINPKDNIQKLLSSIQQIDIDDTDWLRYKARIDAMQQGFLEKLSTKHPNLSRQQLTICSLFRLGMVNKEAAQVLNMGLAALNKSRYRIRKKLNLDADDNLEKYLLQL